MKSAAFKPTGIQEREELLFDTAHQAFLRGGSESALAAAKHAGAYPEEADCILEKINREIERRRYKSQTAACSAKVKAVDVAMWNHKSTFISTGFPSVDAGMGGGLVLGESTALFAPTSVGKSTFTCNVFANMARAGNVVALLSLEMLARDLWRLLAGIVAGVPRIHVRRNTLTDAEQKRLEEAKRSIGTWKAFITDRTAFTESPTMRHIDELARELVELWGLQVLVVDYLNKVGPFGQNDLVRIPMLTNFFFDLGQRLNIHVLVLTQSSKGSIGIPGEEQKISLADAKGSVEIIADFDNVIGLARPDWNTDAPKEISPLTVSCLKSRQGPTGTTILEFNKLIGSITEPKTPPKKTTFRGKGESADEKARRLGLVDCIIKELVIQYPRARIEMLLALERHFGSTSDKELRFKSWDELTKGFVALRAERKSEVVAPLEESKANDCYSGTERAISIETGGNP